MPLLLWSLPADMPTPTPRILITRAKADSERFAELLEGVNAAIHIIPFFEVKTLHPPLDDTLKVDALLVTSQHAVPYAESWTSLKTKPCFVVGQTTQSRLEKAGFHVAYRAESAHELAVHITDVKPATLLYLRGQQISLDFRNVLPASINLHELIVYAMVPLSLNVEVLTSVLGKEEIILPLFSEQTARYVCNTLMHFSKNISIVAMSAAIANIVSHYSWKQVIISDAVHLQSVADRIMLLVHDRNP